MRCEEVQELFHAYLDGELSPTLATELSAHRLHCADCRRALALLEVTGHILSTDRDPIELRGDFTDRLIACVDRPRAAWLARARVGLYVAGPLAAAAVIVLAFLGAFDRERTTRVAADSVEVENVDLSSLFTAEGVEGASEVPTEEWIGRLRRNVQLKRDSGASLQKAVELQLQNLLDAAERGAGKLEDSGRNRDDRISPGGSQGDPPTRPEKNP